MWWCEYDDEDEEPLEKLSPEERRELLDRVMAAFAAEHCNDEENDDAEEN